MFWKSIFHDSCYLVKLVNAHKQMLTLFWIMKLTCESKFQECLPLQMYNYNFALSSQPLWWGWLERQKEAFLVLVFLFREVRYWWEKSFAVKGNIKCSWYSASANVTKVELQLISRMDIKKRGRRCFALLQNVMKVEYDVIKFFLQNLMKIFFFLNLWIYENMV